MTDGDEKILTEDDMELKIKMQSEITQKLQMIDQDLTKLLVYSKKIEKAGLEIGLQWTNIMTDEQKAEFKRISAKLLKELFGFVKEAKGANDV